MPVTADTSTVFDSLNNPAGSAIYSEAPADYMATQALTDRALTLSDGRLDALSSGAAAGNDGHGTREWAEGFLNYAHQGEREGLLGYDQQTGGGAIGVDTDRWLANAILGASFSYGHTNNEPRDDTMPTTHSDSYQLTLYGSYDLGDKAYLRGMAAYGHSFNDADRPSFGDDAHGEYGANDYTLLAKAGKGFDVGDATLTPSILARWTHYDPDSYNESGAGGDDLHVDQNSLDSFQAGPGVDATWKHRDDDGSWLVPSVHAGYRYEFLNDKITTTFSGSCCGTFSSTGPTPGRSLLNAGTSLTWYTTGDWEVKAGYDFDYRDAFMAHTGILRATYRY